MNENINSGKLLNEAVQKLELLSEEQLEFLINSLGEAVDNYKNAGVILQDLMLDVTCYWSELESDDIKVVVSKIETTTRDLTVAIMERVEKKGGIL